MKALLRAGRRLAGLYLRLGAAALIAVPLYAALLFVFALDAAVQGRGDR